MSQEWMNRWDKAEIRMTQPARVETPEERFQRELADVKRRSQVEDDDHVAASADAEEAPIWWLPWQKLGTVLPTKMDVTEALSYSQLAGWDLKKVPMYVDTATGYGMEKVRVPEHFAIQRTGTDGKVLGVGGSRYRIVTNESAFDWAQYLLGGDKIDPSESAYFTSAGSLRGGRVVFLVAKTPFDVTLPGNDKLETYLLITNRHDGNGSVICAIVTIRVVCANTLERSLNGALAQFKIRHTRYAEAKLAEAQHALGLAKGAAERARIAAEKLIATPAGNAMDRSKFYAALLPIGTEDVTKAQVAAIMRHRDRIEDTYQTNPTLKGLDESAWRLYNAVTFDHDHLTPRRQYTTGGGNPETSRMEAIIAGNNIGTRAFELLTATN